jgi:hypothetical protein
MLSKVTFSAIKLDKSLLSKILSSLKTVGLPNMFLKYLSLKTLTFYSPRNLILN